jgi:rhodopsin domain-containing protein
VLGFFLIDLGTGRHLQYIEYVMSANQTVNSEVLDFTAHLIYTTALFFCRLSGLAFYRRLCELHHRLSLAIKCALVLLIAAYIPQMCLIIFHCRPVTGLWPYSWQLRSVDYTCLTWGLVYTVNSGLSLVCDIFMFVIPVALIQTIALPPRRKLHLYMVLLPGVL